MRIGHGYDVHRLITGRKLILGGVEIEHHKGLYGHSDADVLIHAVIDAILGALALGDIGSHFPDSDLVYKGINSRILLCKTCEIMKSAGYKISNIDSTICAQKPRLRPFIPQMIENIAHDLETSISCVSVKATTEEGLGFTGNEEGMSATTVVLLENIDKQ
ncbi:MAG: 2-C-methyl-D-erythritol 2,4-cyclodiphosphate synthase [Candidatus Cloacimonetes bacterium]|nr:2-C-methyl-D-erythritol 2,4-cyclodiphosphate synthase [Candidatus Cloacimonadota bacterium]